MAHPLRFPSVALLVVLSGLVAGCGSGTDHQQEFVDSISAGLQDSGIEPAAVQAYAECVYSYVEDRPELLEALEDDPTGAAMEQVAEEASDCLDLLGR